MKVIIDKWKNGGYSRVDEYPTKAEFIKVVFETEMPVTDGLEHLSDFLIAVNFYTERNGNYRITAGQKEYSYKRGNIIEMDIVTGEEKKYKA